MAEDDKRVEEPTDRQPDSIEDAETVNQVLRPDEPASPVAAPPQEVRRSGGGGFLGLVAGGALAAAAGYGIAQYAPLSAPAAPDISALEARITSQTQQIDALKASLAELAARPSADPTAAVDALRAELDARLSGLPAPVDPTALIENAVAPVRSDLAALDLRLTEVEKRPVATGTGGGVSSTALAAFDRELSSLREQVASQSGAQAEAAEKIAAAGAAAEAKLAAAGQEAERLKTEAEATLRDSAIAAALSRLRAAFETGGPFGSAVADLGASGIGVPPDLAALAETGIPTQADLEDGFPPAARAALEAALRSEVGDSWGDRVTAFLRTQTGVRSVEPREGTDPDAVLSRAEAAVRAGDLPGALTEIGALPESAQAALASWVADASARVAAGAAIAALSAAADAK